MALPEDDVEEVDPEPALARILDHEHDAIVVGPGLRPGLATPSSSASCSGPAGRGSRRSPIVLDAEALRSMATLGEWWTAATRPRRADAPPGRVRAPPRGHGLRDPAADGDLVRRRRGPRGGRPRRGHELGPGRRPEGRADGHRRARRHGHGGAVREPGPRDRRDRRRPRRRDRRAPRPGPRRRATPPGSASTSTGSPATLVRERLGDAGLLASRPARRRSRGARKRLARSPSAMRRASGSGSPSASGDEPGRPERDVSDAGAGGGACAPPDRGPPRRGAACRRCPRTAWLEIDLDALVANLATIRDLGRRRRAGPPGREGRRLRPRRDPGGPGPRGGRRRRLLRRRRTTRRLALRGARRSRRPILVLYPDPGGLGGRRRAPPRIAVSAGELRVARTRSSPPSQGAAGISPAAPLRIQLEVETGLGRGGFGGRQLEEAAARIAAAPRARLAALWTHLQAAEDATATAAPARAVRGAPRRPSARPASGCRRATSRRAAACSRRTSAAYDGVRPGLSIYGLAARRAARGRSARRRAGPRSGRSSSLARPAGPGRRPAGRLGDQLRPDVPDGRPSRIATLPLGYGDGWPRSLSNRAEALVRGRRVPLVGNVAMDAVMADVTDVPGPPVDDRRRVRPPRAARATDEITRRRAGAACAPRTRGKSVTSHGPAPAPGVPCAVRTGGHPDARLRRNRVTRLELWNGDICVLEVDAIVNPANPTLWMSTGVGGALKRAGGDAIEFAAVRQGPIELGEAVVTRARQPRRQGRHPRRLARPRSPDLGPGPRGGRPERVRPGPRDRRHEHRLPGPRDRRRRLPARRGARITVDTVRDELDRSPAIEHVIFALRGLAAYQAFERALAELRAPVAPRPIDRGAEGGA